MKVAWAWLGGHGASATVMAAVLLLYPVPFLLTLAPLFHVFLISCISAANRLV
eukprot:CAMPEP_0204208894 /NCGR_PEP_ID=MMETSP0361-20130328/72822_1 /ASSEMBLY_ACC=CAM_ASM_000343 /TAXON_ID=268821 /ORGANISM="Scrippsiella Hangoei, Strain SHTV-5" /LENGTH=52 /DNA_ID=CAMNT_0051172757 /DNA_START=1 /DNA_END=156 /DNA_ORIENTATION=+